MVRLATGGGGAGPAAERDVEALHGFGRNVLIREDTILKMLFEDEDTGAFEPRTGGGKLGEYVFAGAAFFEHPPERTNLPFDTCEAVE